MFNSENIDTANDDENTPDAPRLKGWRPLRLLAQGAHAEAWVIEAESPHREQRVLKIPRSPADVVALQREKEFAEVLVHPHIVTFLGPVQTSRGEGTLWEYCAAGDALSLVQVLGPMRVSQAVTVLVPLAQALDYAHEQGVVHGDVSPGNVVFDTQGRPKLCDVGEARTVASPDRWTGTEGFCAPELDGFERRDSLQPAADVYSLSALGWFLLTGRLPGDESRRPALGILLPEAHDDVSELLEAGLNPDPRLRPSLTEFSVACYSWAVPEPLQLHALVDERTALFLPTRHEPGEPPAQRRPQGRLRRFRKNRRQGQRQKSVLPQQPGTVHKDKILRRAHTRMGLGVGATVLGSTMILTNLWTIEESEPSPGADQVAPAAAPLPSWDTIVNQWSSQRTEALIERDLTIVASYAVETGPVAVEDRALVETLQDQGIIYEDLSMSAQVDEIYVDGDTAQVLAEWTMSSYSVRPVDDSEGETRRAEGSTEMVWIESRLFDEEWRIEAVTPVAAEKVQPHTNTAAALLDMPG